MRYDSVRPDETSQSRPIEYLNRTINVRSSPVPTSSLATATAWSTPSPDASICISTSTASMSSCARPDEANGKSSSIPPLLQEEPKRILYLTCGTPVYRPDQRRGRDQRLGRNLLDVSVSFRFGSGPAYCTQPIGRRQKDVKGLNACSRLRPTKKKGTHVSLTKNWISSSPRSSSSSSLPIFHL